MPTALLVDRSRLRRWHVDLATRLSGRKAPTLLTMTDGAPLPSSVNLILSLEQLVHRLPGPRPSDRVDPVGAAADLAPGPRPRPQRCRHCRTRGLCASCTTASRTRLLCSARYSPAAVPFLEIVEAGQQSRLGRALPSTETAESLCEAYESVVARAATLADHGPVARHDGA